MIVQHHGSGRGFGLALRSGLLSAAVLIGASGASGQMGPEGPEPAIQPLNAQWLYLANETVDLSEQREGLEQLAGNVAPGKRHVIQLDGPMTPDRRRRLEAAGVRLMDYLPVNAYVVSLAEANPGRAAQLEFVRWHGDYQQNWKLDDTIGAREYVTAERQGLFEQGKVLLVLSLFENATEAEIDGVLQGVSAIDGAVVHQWWRQGTQPLVSATVRLGDLDRLSAFDAVQFVEEAPEITLRNDTNRWIVQSNQTNRFPLYDQGIRGEGQIVGIMDGRVDQSHCSLTGKAVAYNASSGADFHGTHVAGTAVGDNGSNSGNTRGVAYAAEYVFNTIPSFSDSGIYNALTLHHNQGARVHTNSWGDDGTTSYNSLARGFDRFQWDNEDSFVCLAVTNTSSLRNPENAKNLLAVGASQDTPNQNSHCSGGVGPTADGRRKPEIYAPGCSTQSASAGTSCSTTSATGTSMASPAIAGTAALVRQYYTDGFYPTGLANPSDGFTPTGALIKATLINSSQDMTGVSGYPSNLEGWGRVLADRALYFDGDSRKLIVTDARHATDGLNTGGLFEQGVTVLGGSEQLRITLVWMDPPASASTGSASASINDLDLEVLAPDATFYRGNVFSGGASTPGGSADFRNNVEQVHVNSPGAGAWTIRVRGTAVAQGPQGFAIVISGDIDLGPLPISISSSGVPTLVAPATPSSFNVSIDANDESIVPGTAVLRYRTGGSGSFASAPLAFVSGMTYEATLPGFDCDDTPEFYVSVQGTTTGTISDPPGAPGNTYSLGIGELTTVADHDFEPSAQGWTVGAPDDDATTGVWTRVNPNGTDAQPEDDHSDPGTFAFVTGQGTPGGGLGDNDVDGGKTTLFTSVFDLSDSADATISYWRWFSNNTGAAPGEDVFTVDISNNGGSTWSNVEVVGPAGAGTTGGWIQHSFQLSDVLAGAPNQVQLRFIAADEGAGSLVEAAVDDFVITTFECVSVPTDCPGDANGDQTVDINDLNTVLGNFGQSVPPGTNGDVNDSGTVDIDDLNAVIGNFGSSCV